MKKGKVVRLGDLLDIANGYSFKSSYFSALPTPLILLTPGSINIGGGYNNGRQLKYYNGPYSETFILTEGDIVISMTDLSPNSDSLGCAARIPLQPGCWFLLNQRLGKITRLSETLDRNFLYWLLHSENYRHHVITTATGTNVKHTSTRRLQNYRFLLPPLQRQKQIAAPLDAIDCKIDILCRCRSYLEHLIDTIYHQMFVNVQKPASTPLTIPQTLPPGWEMKPLGYFGKVICGNTPSKKVAKYFNGPIPFIKIQDITGNVYIRSTRDSLSSLGAELQPAKQIPPNSICVSCIGTIGKVGITSTSAYTNQQIKTILPNQYTDIYYLYCRLKTMKKDLEIIGSGGSVLLNINTGQFMSIIIPAPPQAVINQFYQTVHPMFQRILLYNQEEDQLTHLKNTLINRLSNLITIPAGES